MAEVDERLSGIENRHARGISEVVRAANIFLFVRPTEYDSTILIKEGWPTKSMDIHDKSSNWGPMSGCVPCDAAFNKKKQGKPDPKKTINTVRPHHQAHGVHLWLTETLLTALIQAAKIARDNAAEGTLTVDPRKLTIAVGQGHPSPDIRLYMSPDKPGLRFCLIREPKGWLVYWADLEPGKPGGSLIPLLVWAYNGTPVTGDYDLWMVAPCMESFRSHVLVKEMVTKHGTSTASAFTASLIDRMNAACQAADGFHLRKVFNHGAEAQNYGFTQALDRELVMFTPTANSSMVSIAKMPGILTDLQNMGYFVLWNKRYEQLDSRLSGKEVLKPAEELTFLEDQLNLVTKPGQMANPGYVAHIKDRLKDARQRWLYKVTRKLISRARFREALDALKAEKQRPEPDLAEYVRTYGQDSGTFYHAAEVRKRSQERTKLRWNLARKAVRHGVEQASIVRFHDELMASLQELARPLTCLKEEDFPPERNRLSQIAQQLQTSFQAGAVNATTGMGETDKEEIYNWIWEHEGVLEELLRIWPDD